MRAPALALLLALAPLPALAQSNSSPGMGGSMAPGAGGPGSGLPAPGVLSDLDLPLERPVYVAPTPIPTPPPPPAPPGVTPPPPTTPTSTATPTPPPPPPPDDPRDMPPPTLYGEEIASETDTLVYVLDVSGSMGWDVQSYATLDGKRMVGPRIDRAKVEISRSILGLSENFRFNVVAYDCGTRVWQRSSLQAIDANKQSALGWIALLEPTGATGTGPAVSLGLSIDRGNKSVVLLTDGCPNCGVPESTPTHFEGADVSEAHRRMISGANTQGARISVFGIAASGTYRAFCQNVAADSGGSYYDVP